MSDNNWLYSAAVAGTAEAFQAKLARSSDAQVKYRDENGWTVLFVMAMKHDWPELAAALIERGCDVNAKNKYGNTALHYAGGYNRRETARVLLEHGADRTIKNKKGETAADMARQNGHADLAAYIDGAHAPRPPCHPTPLIAKAR